ncbi:MAG: hypothetical protein IT364_25085 [Candidatus Hydrogenedentes bacterium]|nr:hypothetical protein [Candidatus Hydrogenedentota bacterium]
MMVRSLVVGPARSSAAGVAGLLLLFALTPPAASAASPDAPFASVSAKPEWRVRPADAQSAFVPAGDASHDSHNSHTSHPTATVSGLGLTLTPDTQVCDSVWRSHCTVRDTTNSERAVVLALCLPINATGWTWWDDPERHRTIESGQVYENLVEWYHAQPVHASYYPLAVISNSHTALCMAVPLQPARMVRFRYDGPARELRAEFDFGLSPVSSRFPSCADAEVLLFEVPPEWAFRQALARYYELYTDAFKRRVGEGGIWMPFTGLGSIGHPEDFGFAYREVAIDALSTVAADEVLGVSSYVYVEPQTNWRTLRGEAESTHDSYLAQLQEDAAAGDRKAQATLVSGIEREDGGLDLYLDPIAWTKDAPFGVNADPAVSSGAYPGWPNKASYEMAELSRVLGWNGHPATGLDGVYVDSMEGWGVLRNYRKDHWRVSRYPLTFHHDTNRVCLMNFWGTCAFVEDLAAQLHARGMTLMGNGSFHRLWQLAPFVDIPGMEYGWYQDGAWSPVPDEQFLYLRALAGPRPYLLLMNNDFNDASHMEEYFQRALFYGCYPSMFHGHTGTSVPYFSNPAWYNRDRPLFQRYVPQIRRLDKAGWRPVPRAAVSPKEIRIERWGDGATDDLAFTLHNPSPQEQQVSLQLDEGALHLSEAFTAREELSGITSAVDSSAADPVIRLRLAPNAYAMVSISPSS